MFKSILVKLYNNAEDLPTEEITAIVVGTLLVFTQFTLNLVFLIIFTYSNIHFMATFNGISLIIGIINVYILLGLKLKNIGLTLMILNLCLYIATSSFLLGYDKNSIVLLPLMILVTFNFFATKPKLLLLNLSFIFAAYGFNIFVKYEVDSMYKDVTGYIDYVNNMFTIFGTISFIYVSGKIESFSKSYTDKRIEDLSIEANLDFLTGLKNRRYMETFFKVRSKQSNAYIVMADIDFFKKVNDTYSHNCGDYVIKEVSEMLTNSFKPSEPVCRWGGEEFLIYVKDEPYLKIEDKLNNLRKRIEQRDFKYTDLSIHITMTFGFTKINPNYEMSKNIRNADTALYYGKSTGRNKVTNFYNVPKNNIDIKK